jgi:sodium ion-translocating decarboxylase beta subunit
MDWSDLFKGFTSLTPQMFLMFAIGLLLIFLAIKKDYEPMLLLPIGFGAILVNLPLSLVMFSEKTYDPFITQLVKAYPDAIQYFQNNLHYVFEAGSAYKQTPGFLQILMDGGILNELFPILIFIAIGAMIDFTPLFKNPIMIFFGAAAQLGIFVTILIAIVFGFDLKTAASIGIIGAADGPTAIYVAAKFARDYLGPITVAAYSYMALVPIIQPPVIRLLTSRKERLIRMDYKETKVSRKTKIFFILSITIVSGIISPFSVPLVGSLMFGNLIRESGVLERLSNTAQNELANLVTILLGITIGSTMSADKFLRKETLIIISLGLVAFIFDTAGGVLFAKFINLFRKEKINPMIGAAGISAFPMSARVVAKMCLKEDPENHILMHAVSANVAGQLGSIIAGGMILALVPMLIK